MFYRIFFLFILTLGLSGCFRYSCDIDALEEQSCAGPPVEGFLKEKNLKSGLPLFIRIFKENRVLELWGEQADKTYTLIKTYKICKYSGKLGPKRKKGDKQAPEGFYEISHPSLKPNSKYYKALNIGYPNAFDLMNGCNGNHIMIHGKCHSVGCYAMTDKSIHEIYHLVEAALKKGQKKINVHIFPFPMDQLHLHNASHWHTFWNQLKPAYEYFEKHKKIPHVQSSKKNYYLVDHPV
jgi:murein L,D-transpeptidase YafK